LDQYNKEVLNINYINRQAIIINAVLHYPGHLPIIISNDEIGVVDNATRFEGDGGFCAAGGMTINF